MAKLIEIYQHLKVMDVLDILVVAFLVYNLLLLIWGTRAMQMILGIIALVVLYYGSTFLHMTATTKFLNMIFFYLPFAIIVLFQNEIRKMLASIGQAPLWARRKPLSFAMMEEVVMAAQVLASRSIGAIVAIEKNTSLKQYAETGVALDARISLDLLVNIFMPYSPLHDGAVIISQERIVAAGAFLPLSQRPDLAKELGTRHRAAVGLAEETDAFVIVVSEERGAISVAYQGSLYTNLTGKELAKLIEDALL